MIGSDLGSGNDSVQTVVNDGSDQWQSLREESVIEATEDANDKTYVPDENVSVSTSTPVTTRLKNQPVAPLWLANVAVLSTTEFALKCDDECVLTDPENYASIAGRPDEAEWKKAMQDCSIVALIKQ